MQYIILLDRKEKTKNIEAQEQSRFVYSVIQALNVSLDEIWDNPDVPLTTEKKIKLRKALDNYNISVIDNLDGDVKIHHGTDLIGQWFKPFYKYKEDPSQKDQNRRVYMEMHVNFWTKFEEDDEEEKDNEQQGDNH